MNYLVARNVGVVVFVLFFLAGCVQSGTRLSHQMVAPTDVTAEEILHDIEQNAEAIQSFRAAGTVQLELPQLVSMKEFSSASIAYRQPDQLHVVARQFTGTVAFRLTAENDAFLVELPTEREYMHRNDNEQMEGLPFKTPLGSMAMRLLGFYSVPSVKPEKIRMVSRDPSTGWLTLESSSSGQPIKRMIVSGPPWLVLREELLDESGQVWAVSERGNFVEIDGIRVPTMVYGEFPEEGMRIRIEMRNIRVNIPLEDSLFDMDARLREITNWTER